MKRINWNKSRREYPIPLATKKQKAVVRHMVKALNIEIDIDSEIITKADADKFINDHREEFGKIANGEDIGWLNNLIYKHTLTEVK